VVESVRGRVTLPGAPNPFWGDEGFGHLKPVGGDRFEVVDARPIRR